ncbi:MAG: c-type cytochrome [Hydrogenophilaceae bacterium]|nr:c-type cytochrome [Hydrogenophilaceae bacterium]
MKKLTLAFVAAGLVIAGPVLADEAMAKKNMCMNCHSVDKKLMGPSFKDVAAKYKGNKDAEKILAESIVKGSKDKFGKIPMPPQAKAAGDAAALAKWIMSL